MGIQFVEGLEVEKAIAKNAVIAATTGHGTVKMPSVTFRRPVESANLTGFETITGIDDVTIKKMIKKVQLVDLVMAMIGSDKANKEAVYRNLPERLREISEITVCKMENGLVPYHTIERSRAIICDAFLEIMREE